MERLQRTLAEIKRHIEALDTEEGLSDIRQTYDRKGRRVVVQFLTFHGDYAPRYSAK